MARWSSTPLTLPESVPEEIREAFVSWERDNVDQPPLLLASVTPGTSLSSTTAPTSSNNAQNEPPQRNDIIDSITENILRKRVPYDPESPIDIWQGQDQWDQEQAQQDLIQNHLQTLVELQAEQEKRPAKRQRMDSKFVAAALSQAYPIAEPFQARARFGTRSDQWKPAERATQRYHPEMTQPLDRQTRWNDYGVTKRANGKVPHESILDFLTDVMRNKHWRGTITNIVSSASTKHPDPFPRTHYGRINSIIASNPFLLRLSQILEGRFFEAASGIMNHVPTVVVHGEANNAVPIKPHYIAAILVQALGRENPDPCSLCAGDWNTPGNASGLKPGLKDVRPFKKCVSLYSLGLPPRFAACGNHFWLASITDCACVNMKAPVHPDERHEYFMDSFGFNAADYFAAKRLLKDEFLQVVPTIPEGFVAFGPFFVRSDIVRKPGMLKYGVSLIIALAQFQCDHGQAVDSKFPETGEGKELRDKLANM